MRPRFTCIIALCLLLAALAAGLGAVVPVAGARPSDGKRTHGHHERAHVHRKRTHAQRATAFVRPARAPVTAQSALAQLAVQRTATAGTEGCANDFFGLSVAISGDTAVVGAGYDDVGTTIDQGSAYVFVRSGGVWSQQAQLTAADGAAGDDFGMSVAIDGDTVVVGAPYDDVGDNGDQGSAYVFVRSGTEWTQQAQLTAADGAAYDSFGFSVALSGETTVVGAFSDDIGARFDQGSAYVFVRSTSTWSEQKKLTAADGQLGAGFGVSAGISGGTIVVGAWNQDVGANVDQGAAYVFVGSGAAWSQQAELTAADGGKEDQLGFSVAVSGDTAIAGAFASGGTRLSGAAYVYVRSGSAWSQQTKLTAGAGSDFSYFGRAVALAGDTAIVGAGGVSDMAVPGAAYAFTRSGGAWGLPAQLTPASGTANDRFGDAVALWGDTVVVGASADDIGANVDQGSASVFTRSGTAWSQQTKLTTADTTPPTTTDDAPGEWSNGPVTITFSATDAGSGMSGGSAGTEYSTDGGASWQNGDSVTIDPDWESSSTDGLEVLYRSTDAAGNVEEPRSCIARIDTQGPWTECDPVTAVAHGVTVFSFVVNDDRPGSPTTSDMQGLRVWVYKNDAVDSGRGKGRTRYRPLRMFTDAELDGMNAPSTLTVPDLDLPAGRYYYKVYATDWAGNSERFAGGNWLTVTP